MTTTTTTQIQHIKQLRTCNTNKGVDLTGLLGGDIKEDWRSGGQNSPVGSRNGAPVAVVGNKVPQKLKLFC